MVRNSTLRIVLILSCLILLGCSSPLRVYMQRSTTPIDPENPKDANVTKNELALQNHSVAGNQFYLQATLLEFQITYTKETYISYKLEQSGRNATWPIEKCTGKDTINSKAVYCYKQSAGAPKIRYRVIKPILVVNQKAPDRRTLFVIDDESQSGFQYATDTFNITKDNNGILQSVNVKFSDKTKEIIEGMVATGINIAKLATIAGEFKEEIVLSEDVSHNVLIDPSELKWEIDKDTSKWTAFFTIYEKARDKFEDIDFIHFPAIKVILSSPVKPLIDIEKSFASLMDQDGSFNGIPYRTPLNIDMSILVKQRRGKDNKFAEVANFRRPISHLGYPNVIPIYSSSFTDRTIGIEFSPTSGALIIHKFSSTSGGEKGAQLLSETTKNIVDFYPSLKYKEEEKIIADTNKQTEVYKAQKAKIEEEINLRKKEKELEDLKKEK